jgi:hypothetical protein
MARKSAASLSVIAGSIDRRPDPPSDLTALEAEVWERTVAHEAADVFGTAALQQMLKDYCRHVVAAERLGKVIEGHMAGEPQEGAEPVSLKDLDCLLKMRDRETKAIADKATKLRLTNQSRYTPKAAATAAKNTGAPAKPWQLGA